MQILTTFLVAASAVRAVLVTSGSTCSSSCGNILDKTAEDEMTCLQTDYEKGSGAVFKTCLECEMYSDYSNGEESDTASLLYNMRFAIKTCLFEAETNQCITEEACKPFQDSILYENSNVTDGVRNYEFCASWPLSDTRHMSQCKSCLLARDQDYLANFFTVLQGACDQQPELSYTVAIEGDIFSSTMVNVTSPTPKASIDPAWFDDGPLDLNAKAGIAAAGFVFILIIIGFCIIWRGRRRRRAFLRDYETKFKRKNWPAPLQTQNMQETTDTPLSQRPLKFWDDSPASEEQAFPRYFSPYSSQFSSPVSGTDAQPQNQQWPPVQTTSVTPRSIGLAFAGDSPVNGDSKGKQPEEAYEMHHVDSRHNNSKSNLSSEVGGYGFPAEATIASTDQQQIQNSHGRRYSGSYRNFSGNRGAQT